MEPRLYTCRTQIPFTQVFVSVMIRPQRRSGVIEVDHAEPFQPEARNHRFEESIDPLASPHVMPRLESMGGIRTEPDPLGGSAVRGDTDEFVETAPKDSASPC